MWEESDAHEGLTGRDSAGFSEDHWTEHQASEYKLIEV